jgi:two-component system, cell cycle response regulator
VQDDNEERKLDVKILYVEDETEVREKFGKFLKRAAREVYTACDGLEGYNLYKSVSPDIIVTDIRMPKVSGLEMAKKIRESDQSTPIVITTAYNESEFLIEALNNRIDYFIFKPIDCDILTSYVTKLANNIAVRKELEREKLWFKKLLDFQKNMVVLTSPNGVIQANKAFLEFFECISLDDFEEKFGKVYEYFASIEDTNYVTKGSGSKWASDLYEKNNSQAKISIKKNEAEVVFMAYCTKIDEAEDGIFVVSFADITEFEKHTTLLERLSSTDSLTGIMNRQKFNELYEIEIMRVKRSGNDLCMIMLDIDKFKDVNDSFGHDVGDTVLKIMTKIVAERIRKTDLFARWGGEEFVVLLPYTKFIDSVVLAQKLRESIESTLFEEVKEFHDIEYHSITCSFGVASYEPGDTNESLMKKADEALYRAKRGGRNRVEEF